MGTATTVLEIIPAAARILAECTAVPIEHPETQTCRQIVLEVFVVQVLVREHVVQVVVENN